MAEAAGRLDHLRAELIRPWAKGAALAIVSACAAALPLGTDRARAESEIRVGLAAPLSGPRAASGLAMQRALEAKIRTANDAGGVNGQRLVLLAEDDGCAAASGEGAARTLVASRPAVVIGHPCASAAVPAGSLYSAAGVPLIAVGARHPDVTGPGRQLVLRLAGRDDRQGAAAAAWLLAHAKEKRVAIVHDRTLYARAIADAAGKALGEQAVTPVAVIGITASHHAYDQVVQQLGETRAEAVLVAGFPAEGSIIVGGLRRQGSSIPVLGSDSMATDAFAAVAAKEGKVEVLRAVEPAVDVRGRRSTSAVDPDALGARAAGALEAWIGAARSARSTDGPTLVQALRDQAVETSAIGRVRFDSNGDLVADAFAASSSREGRW